MQEITNNDGQYTITVTDEQHPKYRVSKDFSKTSLELYLEMYRTLREQLNEQLVFYVNPYLTCKEWGLGLRGLKLNANLEAGNKILWITPYEKNGFYNCICLTYSHFEKLKVSPHYEPSIPKKQRNRPGLCHFAGYKVYEMEYNKTGRWFFIYIDTMKNFDKVVELIQDIGIWN